MAQGGEGVQCSRLHLAEGKCHKRAIGVKSGAWLWQGVSGGDRAARRDNAPRNQRCHPAPTTADTARGYEPFHQRQRVVCKVSNRPAKRISIGPQDQPAIRATLDTDISRGPRQHRAHACVQREAELARQAWHPGQRLGHLEGECVDIAPEFHGRLPPMPGACPWGIEEAFRPIVWQHCRRKLGSGIRQGLLFFHRVGEAPERCNDQVAKRLRLDIGIDQTLGSQVGDQGAMSCLGDAAQLEVRTGRKINDPIAISDGSPRDGLRLRRRQRAAGGADADEKAVARLHGAQSAGAPALDLRGGGHDLCPRARPTIKLSAARVLFVSPPLVWPLSAKGAQPAWEGPPAGIFKQKGKTKRVMPHRPAWRQSSCVG